MSVIRNRNFCFMLMSQNKRRKFENSKKQELKEMGKIRNKKNLKFIKKWDSLGLTIVS